METDQQVHPGMVLPTQEEKTPFPNIHKVPQGLVVALQIINACYRENQNHIWF